MKMFVGSTGILIIAIAVTACTKTKDSAVGSRTEADTEAIEAVMAEYVSGYASKDVESFVKVFTKDAVRMPPNAPAVVGSEAIRAYYEQWFEEESLDVTVTPQEVHVAGDWAVAWGTYEATVTSTTDEMVRADRGKWVNVFKQGADGSWKFHRNIWNSDMPPPANSGKGD